MVARAEVVCIEDVEVGVLAEVTRGLGLVGLRKELEVYGGIRVGW